MANKKKATSKTRLSPLKLSKKVEISPVLAIVIIVVMIAVGYLLVSLTFAAGPGTSAASNPASKNSPQTCGQTTGHVWLGLTTDPRGQVECWNGTTQSPKKPATKR